MTLKDICELIVDCPHVTDNDEGFGYPLIRTPNVGKGMLLLENVHRVSKDVYDRRNRRAKPQPGDLILAREAPAGNVALIREGQEVCLGQRTVLIRPNKKLVVPEFLTYYLLAPYSQHRIKQSANGSTVEHVNMPNIRGLKTELPTLHVQKEIASILSNYDTLININTKRIKLLEESARELYKEWFVRMRFPGYEKAKFVKGIPVGWDVKTIDEICDSVGGGTPSTSNAKYWGGKIKWVTPTDITSKQSLPLINIEGRITEAGLRQSSTKLLPAGAILMTSRASIGFFGICKEQVCTNQGFISIIPNEENLRMYMLCNLMMRREEIISNANGATFLEISKGRFRKMEMLIPNNDVLSAFEERCSTTFDAVYNLEIQNQVLAATRDRLLPRLLSGELKVKA